MGKKWWQKEWKEEAEAQDTGWDDNEIENEPKTEPLDLSTLIFMNTSTMISELILPSKIGILMEMFE